MYRTDVDVDVDVDPGAAAASSGLDGCNERYTRAALALVVTHGHCNRHWAVAAVLQRNSTDTPNNTFFIAVFGVVPLVPVVVSSLPRESR